MMKINKDEKSDDEHDFWKPKKKKKKKRQYPLDSTKQKQ